MSHQLKDNKSFYRSSRDSIKGAGFNFFVGLHGTASKDMWAGAKRVWRLDFLCVQKQQTWITYAAEANQQISCARDCLK